MKKLTAMTLALCGALMSTQSANANAHHSGDGTALSLGNYATLCPSANQGSAVADTRNVNNNGHNVQIVHLKAQGTSAAFTFLTNVNSPPLILTPISFTVEKGNAKYLQLLIQYTPHNGSSSVIQAFVTPDSKLSGGTAVPLISNGNGKYTVPMGSIGIPTGSELDGLTFIQLANRNNCSNHASNIGELQINRHFVGIATDPSSSCGTSCGEAAGDDGPEE